MTRDKTQVYINNLSVVPSPTGVSIEHHTHDLYGIEVCVSIDDHAGVLTVNVYRKHGDEPIASTSLQLKELN
jgi:hypothetical protein